jgi:prepilin-type N-terminal cleavage/methylation domain-containing protein/prepilin-type processing-associated H-X9-DG protein
MSLVISTRHRGGFTLVKLPGVSRRKRAAFTLVELLVVIGIIALLISILLPVLSNVRKQAEQLKCSAALRECGRAIQMYALEFRNYVPPAKAVGYPYSLNGFTYNAASSIAGVQDPTGAYWISFLAKYVTKTKISVESATNADAATSQATVLWGCPTFQKYYSATVGGYNRIQTGYGMNYTPTYTPKDPPLGQDYPNGYTTPAGTAGLQAVVTSDATRHWASFDGTWFKLNNYSRPADRVMLADSQFWVLEALAVPANGAIPGQKTYNNNVTYSPGVQGQSLYDFYRHGKYPPIQVPGDTGYYNTKGGKVAYNILYADGHVKSTNDRAEAYRTMRQRFPN